MTSTESVEKVTEEAEPTETVKTAESGAEQAGRQRAGKRDADGRSAGSAWGIHGDGKPTVTKYVGPDPDSPSRRGPLTDEQAEQLRRMHPDNPIALPGDGKSHDPCGDCGIPVEIPTAEKRRRSRFTREERMKMFGTASVPQQYALCDDCEQVRDAAVQWTAAHPKLVARRGNAITELAANAMHALLLIGRPAENLRDELTPELLDRLHIGIRFRIGDPQGKATPHRFAHVSISQRKEIRRQYAEAARQRVMRTMPTKPEPCPPGPYAGCVLCGVPTATPGIPGTPGSPTTAWRPITTNRHAIGGKGPEKVQGHLCPRCADATANQGAMGPTAMVHALLAYLGSVADDGGPQSRKAREMGRRLAALIADDATITFPGWAALHQAKPNSEAWAHLRLDALNPPRSDRQ